MQSTVHVIDSDPAFTRLLMGRLNIHLPSIPIQAVRIDELPNRTFCENDVILYDSKDCKEKSIVTGTASIGHPTSICLRDQNSFRRSARTLSEAIRNELHLSEPMDESTFPSQSNHRGRLILFISLADFSKRETYISANTTMLRNTMNTVYRLNLMPGIRMPRSQFENSTTRGIERAASGISELLLRLSGNTNTEFQLSSYVCVDEMGFHNFGRPVRSDDIMESDISVLSSLLMLLRKEVDEPTNKASAVVVVEGLPFCKIESICPMAHEIHMVLPDESSSQDPFFKNEIESLFSHMPPHQLKFVNASERVSI